jgi:hypothetical protein
MKESELKMDRHNRPIQKSELEIHRLYRPIQSEDRIGMGISINRTFRPPMVIAWRTCEENMTRGLLLTLKIGQIWSRTPLPVKYGLLVVYSSVNL